MVVRDSGVDDPVSAIARDTVSLNGSVASGGDEDHERVLVIEAPDREAAYAHVFHVVEDLAGLRVLVAQHANSRRSKKLRAGRVRLGTWGRFDHGAVLTAQLDAVLADDHVLSVNSTDDDSVAGICGVYGLLDGLARPDDRAIRSGGANRHRKGHPACHQQGQGHGAQQNYGASHKESLLPCRSPRTSTYEPSHLTLFTTFLALGANLSNVSGGPAYQITTVSPLTSPKTMTLRAL